MKMSKARPSKKSTKKSRQGHCVLSRHYRQLHAVHCRASVYRAIIKRRAEKKKKKRKGHYLLWPLTSLLDNVQMEEAGF